MNFKLSRHAQGEKHSGEKWNAVTILEAYLSNRLSQVEIRHGETADVMYGIAPDGKYVGLILSKPHRTLLGGAECVVISGFATDDRHYWRKT